MMIDKQNVLKARTYIENYYILDVEHIGRDVITYRVEDMKSNLKVWLHEYFPESIAKRYHKADEQSRVYVHPTQSELFHVGKTEFQNLYNNLKMVNHPSIPVVHELFESTGTIFVSRKYNANTKTLREHLNNSTKIFLEQEIGTLALSIIKTFVLLQQRKLQIFSLTPETLLIDSKTQEPIVAYAEYMSFDEHSVQSSIHELGRLLYEMIDKENFTNTKPLQPLKANKSYSSALCGLVNRMISDDSSKSFKTFQELQTLLQSNQVTSSLAEPIILEKTESKFSSYLSLASIVFAVFFIYNIFTQSVVEAKDLTWFDSMRYHLVGYFGDVKGQSALGQMYEKGYYVDIDMKEAIVWYKKAAQQADVDSQLSLANIYKNVEWVKDDKAALEIFSKLGETGNLYAQKTLAYSYMEGEDAPQDYRQAMYWSKKAQEQGDAYSCGAIGWMYGSGHGVEKNLTKALDWFKKGIDRNDTYSKKEFVKLEKEIKKLAVVSLHQKGAQEYSLGYQYEKGSTRQKNHKRALEHYMTSAKLGNVNAEFRLAQLYERSEQIPRDYYAALYWYKKAAQHGEPLAYYRVSKLYRAGHGVKKDDELALQWCIEAAKRGLGVAQGVMGVSYEFGWGTSVNNTKARYWYQLAIESGFEKAVVRLEKLNKKVQAKNKLVIIRKKQLAQQKRQKYLVKQQAQQNRQQYLVKQEAQQKRQKYLVKQQSQQKKQQYTRPNNYTTGSVNVRKCLACHGQRFERHALGKSAIVSNMSSRNIATALKGYKRGTYGGPMKALMKGQVARYSDSALEALSKTIGR
jgi:TPR repeat protein